MTQDQYRIACIDLAFELDLNLVIEANCAVLLGDTRWNIPDTVLCVPSSHHTLWSETWSVMTRGVKDPGMRRRADAALAA